MQNQNRVSFSRHTAYQGYVTLRPSPTHMPQPWILPHQTSPLKQMNMCYKFKLVGPLEDSSERLSSCRGADSDYLRRLPKVNWIQSLKRNLPVLESRLGGSNFFLTLRCFARGTPSKLEFDGIAHAHSASPNSQPTNRLPPTTNHQPMLRLRISDTVEIM